MSSTRETPPLKDAREAPAKSFLLSRWRGEVPLETVFARDMLIEGTLINILAAASGILLLVFGTPTPICVLIYFAPLPWNLFLFLSVWRSAENAGAVGAKLGAVLWFMVMLAL